MTALKALQDIEKIYDIDAIRVNGEPYWPFFRSIIHSELLKGSIRVQKTGTRQVLSKIGKAVFGWHRWFTPHDYIFFSTEFERKKLDGRYIDKLAERTIEILGTGKSLYVEQASDRHLGRTAYQPKKPASVDFVLILAGLLSKVTILPRIEGVAVLETMAREQGIQIDFRKKLIQFLCKVRVVKWLLKLQKNKALFITDYGYFYAVYAAKQLGIPTAEFQHGVIGNVHSYYHPAKKLNPNFTPDFLIAFGEHDRKALAHGRYVAAANIFPVGNFYLDQLHHKSTNPEIIALLKGYAKSVCVPTDFATHEYLRDFILRVSPAAVDTLFILVPREADLGEPGNISSNVIIEKRFSFQETVRHCTFNSCTTSTCCLESLTLGVQNILIDEDGEANRIFGETLTDKRYTVFVKNPEQFLKALSNFMLQPKDAIRQSNAQNYMAGYDSHLTTALNTIVS